MSHDQLYQHGVDPFATTVDECQSANTEFLRNLTRVQIPHSNLWQITDFDNHDKRYKLLEPTIVLLDNIILRSSFIVRKLLKCMKIILTDECTIYTSSDIPSSGSENVGRKRTFCEIWMPKHFCLRFNVKLNCNYAQKNYTHINLYVVATLHITWREFHVIKLVAIMDVLNLNLLINHKIRVLTYNSILNTDVPVCIGSWENNLKSSKFVEITIYLLYK
ncbi:hypothetical protein AGLY_010894 [Aphis glycines]|uniref:Uncharacterized protein n=1 Tax=Aphis glycines TaxID=307491 RepID=A0A6G0TF93_APHGL|nr:hypothetical protein AGLY_010894 [Aphis glycines]